MKHELHANPTCAGCRCNSGTLTRAQVVAGLTSASLLGFGRPAAAAPRAVTEMVHLPAAPPNLSPGAARAVAIANRSPLIRRAYSNIESMARSIQNNALRASCLSLLHEPVPQFARHLREDAARDLVRHALLDAKFIASIDAIDTLLPGANSFERAPQPFWSTPGSSQDSHHAYPGGLVMHELFNARSAESLAHEYDALYFDGKPTIDRDAVVGAALYHDVMKGIVFQWNADGTLTKEPLIAGTGAHHILSGAETIVRGNPAAFTITMLSAHAAPSLGDEVKVADWARAAAIIAGVDPVEHGLLRRSGDRYALAQPPPIEAFISHLSDHDYVLSIHAVHEVAPRIDSIIASHHSIPSADRLWYRNALLSNGSAIALYQMSTQGTSLFESTVNGMLSEIRVSP